MYYNKVILIGYVGKKPEVHYYREGASQALFSIATGTPGYLRKDGTRVAGRTEWHTVVAFGGVARFVEKWVDKGSHLLVEGELRYNNYCDKQGKSVSRTEIWAEKVAFARQSRETSDRD